MGDCAKKNFGERSESSGADRGSGETLGSRLVKWRTRRIFFAPFSIKGPGPVPGLEDSDTGNLSNLSSGKVH